MTSRPCTRSGSGVRSGIDTGSQELARPPSAAAPTAVAENHAYGHGRRPRWLTRVESRSATRGLLGRAATRSRRSSRHGSRSSALDQRFRDRSEAGRELAGRLGKFAGRDDVIVLGLRPRGSGRRVRGCPLAACAARRLPRPQARRSGPRGARIRGGRKRWRARREPASDRGARAVPGVDRDDRGAASFASSNVARVSTVATARPRRSRAGPSSSSTTALRPERRCWRRSPHCVRSRPG